MPWIYGPNDFIHRTRQLPRGAINSLEMPADLLRVIRLLPGDLAQHGDTRQARTQIIVDVFGDSGPFALDRALAFQAFYLAAQPPARLQPHPACHR